MVVGLFVFVDPAADFVQCAGQLQLERMRMLFSVPDRMLLVGLTDCSMPVGDMKARPCCASRSIM